MFEVEDATPADHDGILALTRDAFGEEDVPLVRARLDGPQAGEARWTVVKDGGRVVSMSTLLPFVLRLDGHPVPAGQIEYVATAEGYRRHGLIRRQFEVHHRRSAEAGHVIQFIGGIPYVYRRFGYGYGVDHPRLYHPQPERLAPDPAVAVRVATRADLDRLDGTALDRGRTTVGVTTDHRPGLVREQWASDRSDPPGTGHERLFVARRGDEIVGLSAMNVRDDEQRVYHVPSHLADQGATDAVLAHARAEAGRRELLVIDTTASAWTPYLAAVSDLLPLEMGLYTRIADPVAFLAAIRPALDARLRASAFATGCGSVTISCFLDAVRLSWSEGTITEVARVPALEDPFVEQECGVAPDWFPALALGRWGARGLEARADDVSLGRHAEVLAVLFPERPADIIDGF